MPAPDQHVDWRGLAPHSAAPEVVSDPRFRLRLIYGVFVTLLVLVLVRAAVLEATGGEAFRRSTDRSRSITESIPALRGRLLSRDGVVLACDRSIASLAVDYRYLEDPLNEAWLRAQVRRRLGAAARDPAARAEERSRLRVEILEMHRRLATLCGVPADEWQARCRAIQQRVEKLAANVNSRRQRQYVTRVANETPAAEPQGAADIVRCAVLDLFTPPVELPPPPIAVQEQERPHVVARGLSLDVVAEIETRAKEFPGVEIRREVRRSYPKGSLAANVVGYVGAPQEVEPHAIAPAAVGRSGSEAGGEPWLRGMPGVERRQLDSRGRVVETKTERTSRPGRDVVLTLDATIQRRAEQLLDDFQQKQPAGAQTSEETSTLSRRIARPVSSGGAVLVMDVHSGAILAAASAPRFDPNLLVASAPREIDSLLRAANHPMLDRTAQMAIPPGSVFKTVTAIALLHSATFDPNEKFDCRGYLRRPDAQRCMIYRHFGVGHGPIALRDGLAQSCNVYFQHFAPGLGLEGLTGWAARLGFGDTAGCDWCSDAKGKLPSGGRESPVPHAQERKTNVPRSLEEQRDTEAIAIGQGRLTATPVQVARMMAAVANGGQIVTPHVLADVGLPAELGETAAIAKPFPEYTTSTVPGFSPEKLATLRAGLEAVVADPDGTGYNTVRVATVPIAGKTGTAETGGGLPDHAWFAGYAPADNPRITVVVALEHGGSGAEAAGPVARQVVEHLAERGYFSASRSR